MMHHWPIVTTEHYEETIYTEFYGNIFDPPPEMNHNLKSGPHFWNSSTFSHITMILMCCQLRLSIKYGQQSQNEWIFFFILVLGAHLVKKRSWIDPDFQE